MTRYLLAIPRKGAHPPTNRISVPTRGPSTFTISVGLATVYLAEDRAWFRDGDAVLVGGVGPAAADRTHYLSRRLGAIRLESEQGERFRVTRDPSGQEPCYHFADEDYNFIMSDLDMARSLRGTRFALDDGQLLQMLAYPGFRHRQTAIAGVTEILAGERITIESGRSSCEMVWSPWDYVGPGVVADDPRRLREAVLAAVAASVAESRHPLLELSGGLDSSIIAACLHELGVPFSLVTYVPFGPLGDERGFADAIARAYHRPAHVRFPNAAEIDPTRSIATHLPRPSARCFTQEFDRLSLALARDIGADCILNGGGGDAVLGYYSSAAPLVDRWRLDGMTAGLLRTAYDIAAARQVSTAAVVRAAFRLAWKPRPEHPRADLSFLSPTRARAPYLTLHPWLAPGTNELPAKHAQVRSIIGLYAHLEGASRGLSMPLVFPFMMQPVLETALGIPSWRSCAGGLDRAVARAAFTDLPEKIRARRSKGTFDGLTFDILHRHRAVLQPFLLDGYLAQKGLIDRNALAICLRHGGIPSGPLLNRLLALTDCEAWARATSSAARRPD